MKLRRLNDVGIARFGEFLDALKVDSDLEVPVSLLNDPSTSEDISTTVEVEQKTFSNRFVAASYLHEKFSASGLTDLEKDIGLWSWLSLFYFEQLCAIDSSGKRKPGERARWIPDISNWRKYYRHLLAGPYRIYRAHAANPESTIVLLSGNVNQPGELAEQIASRQELVTNRAVLEAASKMYISAETRRPRRGASGKSAGSARRLAEVLNQFDVTWDLYSMNSGELLTMLPPEFDKFRRAAQNS
jgi:hypothetical protein